MKKFFEVLMVCFGIAIFAIGHAWAGAAVAVKNPVGYLNYFTTTPTPVQTPLVTSSNQSSYYTAAPVVSSGVAVTLATNTASSNVGAQVDIGSGVTSLTWDIIGSYDGGLNYAPTPIVGPVTVTSDNTPVVSESSSSVNISPSNIEVNVKAWTLAGTPTVTIYPVSR